MTDVDAELGGVLVRPEQVHAAHGGPQPAYPVLITATWGVDVTFNGVTTPFNTFTKSQVTALPVTEIQALVIN